MDKIIKLATDVGLSKEQAESASGGVLSLVKKNLGDDTFKQISSKVPGADEAVAKYDNDDDDDDDSNGGGGRIGKGKVMKGLMGMASKKFGKKDDDDDGNTARSGGGGGATDVTGLMTQLTSKGVDPTKLAKFLPQIADFLKKNANVDVSTVLGGGDDDGKKNPVSALKGMAGGFLKK